MSRWSDDRLTNEQIKGLHPKQLIHVIVDQQFDYWYDPCGKSGHDYNRYITKRAKMALDVLREKFEQERPAIITAQLIKSSNDWQFLAHALLDSVNGGGSMGGFAQTTLTRLKNLLWHGELVEQNVLDDIVEATKETK